jgi:hypothetical protein
VASCEKCWRDAGGDPVKYSELVEWRTGRADECTLEEQAGGNDASECPKCHRNTVHCVLDRCINPECQINVNTDVQY